jgi:C-terminal processing protease CtpA/Prc
MRSLGIRLLPLFLLASLSAQQPAPVRKLDSADLQRAHLMLKQAHDEIRKNYYDPAFHGVDIDKTYQQFDARLDASQSINETFRVVAAYMLNLHDSHVFFIPPMRTNRSTPGFAMQVIGEKVFVTRVRPGSDAATKLHVGDQVLAFNNYKITSNNFEDMYYLLQVLSPAPSETLDILSPAGEQTRVTVNSLLHPGKAVIDISDASNGADYLQFIREGEEDDHLNRSRYIESGNTMIWKFPSFEVDPNPLNTAFTKATHHQNLIIDLRGNSGGYILTLKDTLGHLFNHDVKLADIVSRKDKKPEMIKPRSPYYSGKVTVLIDHKSASAAELFARVIQLEKRGDVIGDISAGAVMEALPFEEEIGSDYKISYEFSITSANVLMTDGNSLENVGVVPDLRIIPSAKNLAAGEDPVLANAAHQYDLNLDSAAAGKLFPYEWAPL